MNTASLAWECDIYKEALERMAASKVGDYNPKFPNENIIAFIAKARIVLEEGKRIYMSKDEIAPYAETPEFILTAHADPNCLRCEPCTWSHPTEGYCPMWNQSGTKYEPLRDEVVPGLMPLFPQGIYPQPSILEALAKNAPEGQKINWMEDSDY